MRVELITRVADDLVRARDDLNRLDGMAGDGDLGLTLATAAASVMSIREYLETASLSDGLRRCGMEVASKAPSTSGTLLARALLAAGKEASRAGDAQAAELAGRLAEASAAAIMEHGKSRVGEKTMLDALCPAAGALSAAAAAGLDVAAALVAAAGAAQAGAEATKTMVPMHGRARWLADRSAGQIDAGAYAVALIFESLAGVGPDASAVP
jgi:dihydroxyacetone kinase-like protein